MNIEIILCIFFILFLIIFLIIKRKNIAVQKIIYPILYIIMYRSNFGIKFIDKTAKKYQDLIIFFGQVCMGLGFIGMIIISLEIVFLIYNLVISGAQESGVALVLPFTNVPGIGYLSFLHWIIAIFILAVIHEFSHGIVAKANGLEIKSSGFAFFTLIVPLFPAAFVEPDEQKLQKKDSMTKYSIFAAGPMVNIIFAILLLIAFPFVWPGSTSLAPFESTITEPVGFSFDLTNDTLPAAQAGLESGMIIDSFNGESIINANKFLTTMYYCVKPNQTVTLGIKNNTYSITAAYVDGRGLIGINNVKNERTVKPEYEWLKHPFYWIKELIRWLFLLNLFVGLFNLLPLGIVDGGRMLDTFLQTTMKNKKRAKKIWGFVSMFFLLALLFGLITSYLGNPFAMLG